VVPEQVASIFMPARDSRGRAGRAARVKRVKPRRRDARRRPSFRQTGTSPHPRRVTSSPCSGDPVHYALGGITAIVMLDDSKANALSREVVDARRDGRHLGRA